jgi:hypothetical protein
MKVIFWDIEEKKSDNALLVEADDDSLSDSYYHESVNTHLLLHDSNEESDSALRLSHTLHQPGIVHENLGDYREAMICYEEGWLICKLHLTRVHVIMPQSLYRIKNLKLLDCCNYRCNTSEKKKINIDFRPIQMLKDSGENERNKVRFCDENNKRFVWKVSRNLMEKTMKISQSKDIIIFKNQVLKAY